jgi:hypothetical protein
VRRSSSCSQLLELASFTGIALSITAIRTSYLSLLNRKSGDKQIDARLRAAREGVLIVDYMSQFCSHTYPDRMLSQLEACYVSVMTEMMSSYLWLHQREVDPVDGEVYYWMEPIWSALLAGEKGNEETVASSSTARISILLSSSGGLVAGSHYLVLVQRQLEWMSLCR